MTLLRRALPILLLALAAVSAHAAPANSRVLVLDPQASKVSFTLPATGHDVEGALVLKSGRIEFDPATGAASGEIAIDLKTAETGNKSRDRTMHQEVLETEAFPLALFRAERLRGNVPAAGVAEITLDGTLSLHGSDHKVSLPAKIEVRDGHLKAETQVPVPFVEWGLHDPSMLMFRVSKVVSVKVVAQGTLQPAAVAAGTK